MIKKSMWIWVIVIIIIIIIVISIPFIINESYKVNDGYLTKWGANDLLIFYGTFLSFAGTVFLGSVALIQNKKANEINEKLSQIEKDRFQLEIQPFVLLTNWKIQSMQSLADILFPKILSFEIGGEYLTNKEKPDFSILESDYLCLSLNFTNTSNSFVLANYTEAEVYQKDILIEYWGRGTVTKEYGNIYIKSGDEQEIKFFCSKEKMVSFLQKTIRLQLILENRFHEKYTETIDIEFSSIEECGNEFAINLFPQNYIIKKCSEKDKIGL